MFHVDFLSKLEINNIICNDFFTETLTAFALHAEGRMFESHAAATDLNRITG